MLTALIIAALTAVGVIVTLAVIAMFLAVFFY